MPSTNQEIYFNILRILNIHKSFSHSRLVRFKIFAVVSIEITVFCNVMSCNLVDGTYISEEPAASILRIRAKCCRFLWNISTIYKITWHSILKNKGLNSRVQDLCIPDPVINIITYTVYKPSLHILRIIFQKLQTTEVIKKL